MWWMSVSTRESWGLFSSTATLLGAGWRWDERAREGGGGGGEGGGEGRGEGGGVQEIGRWEGGKERRGEERRGERERGKDE